MVNVYYTVARGRSLFGDPASEIQNLTQIIKEDIAKLNSDIAGLQQYTRAQANSRIGSKHLKSHSGAVVISLQVIIIVHIIIVMLIPIDYCMCQYVLLLTDSPLIYTNM